MTVPSSELRISAISIDCVLPHCLPPLSLSQNQLPVGAGCTGVFHSSLIIFPLERQPQLINQLYVNVTRLGVMVHTYNPSTMGAEKRESRVQGQPSLHSELQSSLGYNRELDSSSNKRYTLPKGYQRRSWGQSGRMETVVNEDTVVRGRKTSCRCFAAS